MQLLVTNEDVQVEEIGDCSRLKVLVGSEERGRLGEVLRHARAGWVDEESGDVFVSIVPIVVAAVGVVGEGWWAELGGMLAFARSRNWLSADGGHLRAHVEVAGEPRSS